MPIASMSDYIAPRWDATEDKRLGWLREASEEGDNYLKSQRNWRQIDKAIDIIGGSSGLPDVSKKMSRLHINMLKRDIRENVATLANMRPLWGYKTDNQDFHELAAILNKLLLSWYLNTFADRSIRKALQYAAACCRGYVSPVWKNDFWVTGRGDIKLVDYGPRDVKPIQIGRDHDIQGAYAVDIVDEVPFAKACATYPLHTDLFSPDRSTPTWMRSGIRRVQKFLSPVLNRFGPGTRENSDTTFPTVDIHTTYIMDLTFNDSGNDVWMGEPGTKWYYKVPSYKSEIPTGVMNSAGQVEYVKATLEDALMFPMRRKCVWTQQGVIYDNSSPYWHKKVPLVAFELDDWPWEFLGNSMTNDGASIQDSVTRLARAIDDSANARLDPGLQYDESTMSESLMQRFNPRVGGQRIKTNMQMGEGIKPILPPAYYDVPQWIGDFIEKLWEKMHYLLGTRDIQAIAKAKQVPSGDSLEKLMEMAGPLVTDMSRNMEKSMRDLGEQWKGLAMQFYDTKRRVQMQGKDGITEEDYDYDPGNMIPSHLPDEMARIKAGTLDKNTPSRAGIVQRAQMHLDSCYFHVTPNSLHQITQLTRKLLLLQLFKAGFPIDPWTIADSFDLDNFGTPDKVAKLLGADKTPTDMMGRWIMFKELMVKLGGADGKQKGRPPSGQQSPAIQSKDGGARSTVRESPR
jgi:hypothetical protein